MLITKTVTKTEEQQVELKIPYFAKGKYNRVHMLCEDGRIIEVGHGQVTVWENTSTTTVHSEKIDEIVNGTEITEEEFMTAYEATIKQFETSMFPEVVARYSDGSIVDDKPF